MRASTGAVASWSRAIWKVTVCQWIINPPFHFDANENNRSRV